MGDIAIVGMAGRFPGAGDLDEFWANLCGGVESISFFSEQELAAAGVPVEEYTDPNYVRAGSRLSGVDTFDAEFFGYTAREAQIMDPQQRIFLESAWEALEHAGYDAARYRGDIGVFAGAGSNGYLRNVYSNPREVEAVGLTQILVGNELNFLTSRVSYKLDLRGPSVSLRTACSTALVAVHTACRSLLGNECDMALSGGAHVYGGQDRGYLYQDGSFLSPDGHCRPFDANARGTVFGSGVGVVVLKRLADAVADGDSVYAVIKGSAVNNDGSTKVGFTAPSVGRQAAVISEALTVAGVVPDFVGYVEAHGTGTPLGDPVEILALSKAFRGLGAVGSGFCRLGSLKSNIGHLDAASGIAGLLKVVLCVRAGVVPPTLHFERGNPEIDFGSSPFRVVRELEVWEEGAGPRRAGVSAFGFGGTNAHVVVEQAPVVVSGGVGRGSEVVVLSARSERALEVASDRLAGRLRDGSVGLADVAFTLACGRRGFPYRRVVVGSDVGEIAAALQSRDPAGVLNGKADGRTSGVVFLFSGQGGQYAGMGRGLYEAEPVFRGVVDRCAGELSAVMGVDVRDYLFAAEGSVEAEALVSRTDIAQPALFVLEYALVELWKSWGVTPTAMVGHSLGEYVAACVSGVFQLRDALKLVALRGQLMQEAAEGLMVSVAAERQVVESLLPAGLSLAAHNGPRDCVVAGAAEAVELFAELLAERGINVRRVVGSRAFHSALMDPVVGRLVEAVAAVRRGEPGVAFVSNVTGTWATAEVCEPEYWGRHARQGVEFWAGVAVAVGESDVVLEVGPGQTLSSAVRHGLRRPTQLVTASLPHRSDRRGALECAQRALSQLWLAGVELDWEAYFSGRGCRRVGLPTYPFERRRYWLEAGNSLDGAFGASTSAPQGRRHDLGDWFYLPSWQRDPLPRHPRPEQSARWLIFADDCGLGQALADRLRGRGDEVAVVSAGPGWTRTGDCYQLDPREDEHYDRLITSLQDDHALPSHIVHCWSLTAPDAEPDEKSLRQLGFDSLLLLAKAIGEHGGHEPRRMWVLSNGIQDVTGQERLQPGKATLLGPCRVIPREQPNLACRSIDLVLDGESSHRLLNQLLAEFTCEPGAEAIAYRGPHRWSRHFVPRHVPAAVTPAIRPGGVYLITGGLGGLGLALAQHLAKSGAKLLLTARTGLPPAEQWADLTRSAHGSDRLTGIVRRLLDIQELGAEVVVVQADVSDRPAMQAAVDHAVRRWGGVDGAFHAAGVPGGGLIQLKTRQAAAEVLTPKVDGTLVLVDALKGQSLDFLVLFGSNAANTGDLGQVDYCAANCFLDAYAHASSGRVLTLDWTAWQEVGMAADAAVPAALRQARQQDLVEYGIPVGQGLEALDRVLANWSAPQVVVCPTDLSSLLDKVFVLADDQADLDGQLSALPDSSALHARPQLPTTYVAPRGAAERRLCEAWGALLGIDGVGVEDNFFDLGGNSLVAIQLVSVINRAADTTLSVVQLYECLTVSRLAALLDPGTEQAAEDSALLLARKQKIQKRRENHRRRQFDKEGKQRP